MSNTIKRSFPPIIGMQGETIDSPPGMFNMILYISSVDGKIFDGGSSQYLMLRATETNKDDVKRSDYGFNRSWFDHYVAGSRGSLSPAAGVSIGLGIVAVVIGILTLGAGVVAFMTAATVMTAAATSLTLVSGFFGIVSGAFGILSGAISRTLPRASKQLAAIAAVAGIISALAGLFSTVLTIAVKGVSGIARTSFALPVVTTTTRTVTAGKPLTPQLASMLTRQELVLTIGQGMTSHIGYLPIRVFGPGRAAYSSAMLYRTTPTYRRTLAGILGFD
ncbi:hypothetical protein ACPRNU_01315 [Chromobacterium vaccinii]|uniref:hypothetical protein n=1 Tax=Chromobacterium vaccinii TaxID=1108595 RepID=UPI003C7305B6